MDSSTIGFDPNNFEKHWENLDEETRADLLKQAVTFQVPLGIQVVIHGLLSFQFNLRSLARKSLNTIIENICRLLDQSEDREEYFRGIKESAMVGARIYQQIKPDISFSEVNFFLTALLQLGDKGAYFAFKTLLNGVVSVNTMEKIICNLTETQSLCFVDQYLRTTPEIRLKYGKFFKKILKDIAHREPVIGYYARLFDQRRGADPFLNNIRFSLRDFKSILKNEIVSPSPPVKIAGLKALAMMSSRIPSQVLIKALEQEQVKKVRVAVYNLVENSSMGLYPELFDPILKLFYQSDRDEALHAFKALVVTEKVPLYELVGMVRKNYPKLIPDIHIELADLSRIAFFFIQDIALNKDKYYTDNLDINMACILGMIKKRPERMVRIMKQYEGQSNQRARNDVTGFVEKARQLLLLEKNSIETQFNIIAENLAHKPEKTKSLFLSFFKDPQQRKIQSLRNNVSKKAIDFQGLEIEDQDLSDLRFSAAALYFNKTCVQNSDFSNSYFENAYFKASIFYNVNMKDTVFDGIDFDNSVFINVDARGAKFQNCSFQGAKMFNCNFNKADLTDAVFIDAVISKSAFSHTRLSGACFTQAEISGVSLSTAYLDHADFSGVSARFSRFPSYFSSVIHSQDIEYNARQYQLSFNDLPCIDKALVSEINMLIFCEFIHYGEIKFLGQNKLSLLTAFDIFKTSQAELFQIIPLLVHENIQFLDTGVIDPATPCGIFEFLPSEQSGLILEKYTGKNKFKRRRSLTPSIEGLFTMGSVGSIAQTAESDIDYWVCVNEDTMTTAQLALLRGKLKNLEILAKEKFKIYVTFFLVDILKAKNNDFGGSSQESSGSAQTRLLKEEFYRTMIHVAGKLPLWAVLPTSISLNYYNMILKHVSSFSRSNRYIDLGDIHAIPVNEYFGASIWQMFKWLKSPFKSVIKMALLETYIHAYGKEALLCNQYKDEWMNSGTHLKLAQNDSYIILLNKLLAYYESAGDSQSMNLILTCFFLKLQISKESEINNTVLGLRKILLDKCLSDWKWDQSKLFEIGSFRQWKYAWVQRLSATIEKYMLTKYNKVKQTFKNLSNGGGISDQDREVLERRVDIVYLEKTFKIKKILLVSKSDQHFTRLHIKHIPEPNTSGKWELVHKNSKTVKEHQEILAKAETIEQIGAWLVNNSLYNDNSVVNLVPNPTPVTHDDIKKLFKAMNEFFKPELNRPVRFNELRKKTPMVVCLFICINFYAPKQQSDVTDYCAVYINSWGEMFYCASLPGKKFSSLDAAKKDILSRIGVNKLPINTSFYFSRGMAR